MSRVCENWSLEELTDMNEADMEELLGFYGSNKVPSLSQVRGNSDFDHFEFDGSFGWW